MPWHIWTGAANVINNVSVGTGGTVTPVRELPQSLVGLLGLIRGWDGEAYSNAFLVLGSIFLFVGVSAVMGTYGSARSSQALYAASVSPEPLGDRTQQHVKDVESAHGAMFLMLLLSIMPLAVGVILSLTTA